MTARPRSELETEPLGDETDDDLGDEVLEAIDDEALDGPTLIDDSRPTSTPRSR